MGTDNLSLTKICTSCQKLLPLGDFHDGNSHFGKQSRCKRCQVLNTRKARRRLTKNKRADYVRYHYFGMRASDFQAMLKQQNYKCAICGVELIEGQNLAVDHDHKTGQVRGVLCRACNNGLGFFKDSPSSLSRAAEYLEYAVLNAPIFQKKPMKPKTRFPVPLRATLLQLYVDMEFDQRQIAALYRVSVGTVQNWFRKRSITPRPTGRSSVMIDDR